MNGSSSLKNRFDAVVFDMDGLLLDSERISLLAFRDTVAAFDLPLDDTLFIKTVGMNGAGLKRITAEELTGQADPALFRQAWFNRYLEMITDRPIPVKAGVMTLLTHLQFLEMPIAVATSTGIDAATKKLENAQIAQFFQFVIGGDQVENGKPDPEIYLKATNGLSSDPKRTLGLEDSENGVRAAVAAGLTVIQIPDMVQPSDSLRALGHIILPSLDHVLAYEFC